MYDQTNVLAPEAIIKRNNVQISGEGEQTIILAHGFGCDQNMWRFIKADLEKRFKVVVFDYVGSGKSQLSYYIPERYKSLEGYALDVIEICDALSLENVIFVGHSVSGTIGLLASQQREDLFSDIALVCPSPCFLNIKPEYFGGFDKEDLEELVNLMDKNYIGWANYLAPLVMGQSNPDELVEELTDSFCSTDPKYSKPFAMATFFSDYRALLPSVTSSCLVLQSSNDSLAAVEIGKYMESNIPQATLDIIDAKGHCLHMTEPQKVLHSLLNFLDDAA
ncbi:alpha/beta fold hydrolase [Marinomonas algicola]|uniref:alpha/beta fold hydrolase n=1 Tax=Marinomonas algicola TaxID=2773454 RepID=UPI00174B01F4|nr:alpha/beta hydrolase [Marinomonas algicola]